MKKSRKIIALTITLVLCLSLLAACAPDAPGGTQPQGPPTQQPTTPQPTPELTAPAPTTPDTVFADHIDIIMTSDVIAVINPLSLGANTTPVNWAFTMVYDRLVERNHETGSFLPSLATSWETADYQSFIFNLRDDVYFHNGDRFTADDVVNTINMAKENPGAPANTQWGPVESVRAIDPTTVELVLSNVNVDFLFNVSMPSAGILNQSAIMADDETGPWVGTGPYIVVDFASRDFTVLTRNDNYWNPEKNITTPSITLRFVPEMGARAIRMQTGESQLSFGTSAEDVPLFQNDPDNFLVIPHTWNFNNSLSFNMADPITSDYHFRRAVMYALDKEEISILAASEWAGPDLGSGTLWGFETEFRNNNIPPILHDLERARYHLELSNYNGEEIEIATAIITNVRASQAIQNQLQRIGINTRIEEFDVPGLNAHMFAEGSTSQLVKFHVAMTLSASSYRHIFHTDGAQNRMNFSNPVIDQMLTEAASMTNESQRRDLYMRMQEIIAEDPPIMNIFWRVNATVAANGIGGLGMPADLALLDLREVFLIVD